MMSTAGVRTAKAGKEKSSKAAVHNTKSGTEGKSADSPNPKIQPTAEQLRLAQIINDTKESDDPELKNKIDQVTELTGKTRDEAVVALHDCDNDPNRAIDMLLDGDTDQGEWELSGKKKKNRQTPPASRPVEGSAQNSVVNNKENRNRNERGRDQEKEHDNSRSRGPPRMSRGGANRSWRGRETEKNERNLEDRNEEKVTEGRGRGRMMNGPGRGRGRGGPRSRTFQNRGASHGGFPRSIETWSNSTADHVEGGTGDNSTMSVGNWADSFPPTEDWDNEDWNGSLSETKVFTPSASVSAPVPPLQDSTNTSQSIDLAVLLQKSGQTSSSLTNSLTASQQHSQFLSQFTQQATESLKSAVGIGIPVTTSQSVSHQSVPSVVYSSSPSFPGAKFSSSPSFSSISITTPQILSAQASSSLSNSASCLAGIQSNVQNSRLSSANGSVSVLPQRTKSQKTRLPPPSKIPSSAVEMPDDAITSLDVQFGALEFGSEPSFEFSADASSFQTTSGSTATVSSLVTSMANSPTSSLSTSVLTAQVSSNASKKQENTNVSAYIPSHPAAKNLVQNTLAQSNQSNLTQSGLVSALPQSQKDSDSDLIPFAAQPEKKNATPFGTQRPNQSSAIDVTLSSVGKAEPVGLVTSYVSQNNQTGSYQSSFQGQKSSFASHQSSLMSGSNFSHSSLPNHPPSLATQSSLGGQTTGFSVSQTAFCSGPSSTSVAYPSQVQTSFSTSTQATPSYQGQTSSAYTTQPQSTFPTQNQVSFGTHQSASLGQVASAGFSSSSQSQNSAYGSQAGYGSSVSTVQTHTSLHASVTTSKLSSSLGSSVKDSALEPSSQTYDACHVTSSSGSLTAAVTTTTNSSISSGSVSVSSGLNLPTGSLSGSSANVSKASLSTSKTGMPNMPPGVPVLGHQYIMSQASVPFYSLQQPFYSMEDFQMLQQRLPLHYYDLASFPSAATSLTGRESGLANVAYSAGADGKFGRGDTNSPVPTTLSQQQTTNQQHQQTFINPAALPPGYGYYYPAGGMVPGTYTQYGAPIFSVPPVTNATNNTQFHKATAYGSHGYSSGYDNIGQTQDYKGGYGSASQSQNKGVCSSSTAGGSTSGADISGSVYSKTHNQLGKSFDKPGFPTGTPPPFNMPGTQAGPMGTPSTPFAPAFIAMMAQHPSPMLHHQLHPESQGTGSQRSNPSGGQQKSSSGQKQNYNQSYWGSN